MKLAAACVASMFGMAGMAMAGTVVDDWGSVEPPKAPALEKVTVAAATTAYMVLDIQNNSCTKERRPRCVDAVPAMADFLKKARAAGMPVVYSNTSSAERKDIVAAVAPLDSEPSVKASVDKFYGTDLDKILKGKGIDTVIVCGTTSFGAVLFTATEAAARGYKVVLPVDCMPGSSLYEEQLTVWTVLNGPGTRRAAKATTLGDITIE